jgi:hypothetical protein
VAYLAEVVSRLWVEASVSVWFRTLTVSRAKGNTVDRKLSEVRLLVGNGPVLAGSLALAYFLSGCGALTAMTKPSTLMAPKDEAPLTVVVQRAEAANSTATQVDRLLTATPADNDSVWPKQTQLSDDTIAGVEKQLADHPYYDGTSFRISPAIVWADELAVIHSDAGTSPSLLAALSTEIGDGYKKLQGQVSDLATLQGRVKTEEVARDQDKISDADRKAHQATIDALNAQIETAKTALDPAKTAFVASCRVSAAKVTADVRDRFAIALINLREAVKQADVANGVAVLRYSTLAVEVVRNPLMLKDALVAAAKANASDYIFEKTGKRLKFSGLSPEVKYENGKVELSLNGISPEDLGSLQPADLLVETTARTERFAGEAVALLSTTSVTDGELSFEGDVLDAILEGFHSAGWQSSEPARIAARTPMEIHAGSAAPSKFQLFGK